MGSGDSWPSGANGVMPQNRIRELRKVKGVTSERLAELVGISQPHMSRLEGNKRMLLPPLAEKIAGALGVTTAEVLGLDVDTDLKTVGFAEDVSVYEPGPSDPMAAFVTRDTFIRTAESNVLNKVGIHKGDTLVVNISERRVKMVAPLEVVLVRYHPAEDFMKPLTLLRQFVPQRLLITHSTEGNLPSIDMDEEDAHIIGVVTNVHRRLGS